MSRNSSWLQVRGRTWWGERELLDDQDEWRYGLT